MGDEAAERHHIEKPQFNTHNLSPIKSTTTTTAALQQKQRPNQQQQQKIQREREGGGEICTRLICLCMRIAECHSTSCCIRSLKPILVLNFDLCVFLRYKCHSILCHR